MVAFTLMLLGMLVFAITLANYGNAIAQNTEDFFLEEKTLAVADSLVKNNNPENYLLGACIVDAEKKRVRGSELSGALLAQAKPFALEGFFVKSVSIARAGKPKQQINLSEKVSEKCLSAKRFALVDNEKAIIEIEGCVDE